jgi:hypothetical protein
MPNIAEKTFFSCSMPTFASLQVYRGVKRMVENYDPEDLEVVKRRWLGLLYFGKSYPKLLLKNVCSHVGFGLFAGEYIETGRLVGEYTGLVKKRSFLISVRKDYIGEYTIPGYPVKYIIDAEKYGSLMRYINHSEEANVYATTVILGGILRVFVVAKKPIAPGEQLLIDYGPHYWRWRASPLDLTR